MSYQSSSGLTIKCFFYKYTLLKQSRLVFLASFGKTSSNTIYSRASPLSPSLPITSSTGHLFNDDAEILPLEVSKMPSSSFPAHALFAAGPMDISLRQVSLDPMPDYMYEKLADECASADSTMTGPPQIGKFYAALIDGRWERVLCLRASKIG